MRSVHLDIGDFHSLSILSYFHGGNRGSRIHAVHRKNLRWLGRVIARKMSERHARGLRKCFWSTLGQIRCR
jgi:hypothetical protein